MYDPASVGYIKDKSPYRRGMQTATGSMDLDEFTECVQELLKRAWGETWGTFQQSEPTGNDPDSIDLPIIAFDTNGRFPSKSHKSPEPILFDKIPDPDRPQSYLMVRRQWFDMELVFFVFHTTNREARILMEDFEIFLSDHKDHFKKLGISDIRFSEEQKPAVMKQWGKELPMRTLVYQVRLERVITTRSGTMQDINAVVEGQNNAYQAGSTTKTTLLDAYNNLSRKDD